MSYFGDQIMDLRKKQGLSQEEFADRIGVSRQIVSRWENGSAIPRSTRIKIICDEFKISPDILFGTEESIGKNESHPVGKKRLKLISKGIAILLLILLILYIIYSVYKLCILNYIDNKFKEYDNWTNYYAEIKTYEEAELISKVEIWYKDNQYKILSENYYDKKASNIKWINCNNNKRTEYDFNTKKTYTYEQNNLQLSYYDGKYIKTFFTWLDDIRNRKLKICTEPQITSITNNKDISILKINKNILRYDRESLLPISYNYNDINKMKHIYFKIKLNEVKDEDIINREDL